MTVFPSTFRVAAFEVLLHCDREDLVHCLVVGHAREDDVSFGDGVTKRLGDLCLASGQALTQFYRSFGGAVVDEERFIQVEFLHEVLAHTPSNVTEADPEKPWSHCVEMQNERQSKIEKPRQV